MKMRFWQKTYIITLVLFLLCLNVGIFSLAYYTYYKNVESVEDACQSEQFYIAKSFERDYVDLQNAGNGASPSLLMQSYGNYYGEQQTYLLFLQDGNNLHSTFPEGFTAPMNKEVLSHETINGVRHVVISADICDGTYTLVFGKNVASLDAEFRALTITFGVTAVAVSGVLAICLFFVLKKLSVPLEKLKNTTEQIAAGDYNVTADASGKDEFSQLAKSFNTMVGCINTQIQALELNAAQKQQLVDNLAHELRTPLTSIHGYAEYLQKAVVSEEEKIEAATYIMSESERLQKISEKLLDMAFIRNHTIERQQVNLSQLFADVVTGLVRKADESQIALQVLPSAENVKVQGDRVLLSMLFYNLVENAIKACDPGGKVMLSCESDEEWVVAQITDNGKGMTEEQLAHITEPFYRTDKSRSRAEGGTGLGLALCRQIVQSHGASMDFSSTPAEGTEVKVKFTT